MCLRFGADDILRQAKSILSEDDFDAFIGILLHWDYGIIDASIARHLLNCISMADANFKKDINDLFELSGRDATALATGAPAE